MAYCTAGAVSARLPAVGLAKDQVAMDTLISEGISWADAQIDSRLGSKYTVPFVTVPALVRHISADLAASFVIDSSLSGGGEDDTKPLSVRLAQRAEQALRNIERGSDIVSATEPIPTAPPAYHSAMGQKQILERFPVQPDRYSRHNRLQVNNPNHYPPDSPVYPPYPFPS